MPNEEVEITLSETDPYWSGALYLSVLAYPDQTDATQRRKFHHALARWALESRTDLDHKWAQELQLIRPAYFTGSDTLQAQTLNHGVKRLNRGQVVASYVVLPHLKKFDSRRLHTVEGLSPTVNNMLTLALAKLELKEGSKDTLAARDWRRIKPVAHAICAFYVWENILWKMRERKTEVNRRLAFLLLPEYVQEVAEVAEVFRSQISQIDEFRIREQDTIRIVTRWL